MGTAPGEAAGGPQGSVGACGVGASFVRAGPPGPGAAALEGAAWTGSGEQRLVIGTVISGPQRTPRSDQSAGIQTKAAPAVCHLAPKVT